MSGQVYRIIESERLPSQVGAFEFYYSRRFEMAAMACACGCGHRVMLNLLDQHQLIVEEGLPTITPSILVSDAPCLSHFFVRCGEVEWAQQWSKKMVDNVMQSQVRRHVEQDRKQTAKRSSMRRFVDWIASWFN
ncbi:DUF6527 family protein [Massilia glaciei]|uniref:Uncharacterized protein n=1 Tax=Massilia glaciei TaxID=1524097 RepID=A0A2U2HPH2_9BURK|nr:DUF6527 family protein [Massilia glaciei]PWF49393.1 hypothetical protein C7C56_006745 [Massilia glaciei]